MHDQHVMAQVHPWCYTQLVGRDAMDEIVEILRMILRLRKICPLKTIYSNDFTLLLQGPQSTLSGHLKFNKACLLFNLLITRSVHT